ncbi:MAG: hypothetical protein MJ106_04885, partial [Lentisphaeria bacterium]|nr:hypothetical protein [Lentisphaeria bacterium]
EAAAKKAEQAAAAEAEAARIAKEQAEAEAAKAKAEEEAAKANMPKPASFTGIIVPLGAKATVDTTHAICHTENGRYIPDAYLRSDRIALREWEGMEVTVSGFQKTIEGWIRPQLIVTGVILK